jgi:hypothetical protein
MKTDELIALLARDATPVKGGAIPLRLIALAAAGAIAAFAILVPWLGIRPDLAAAVTGLTFWMKAVYTFGLGAAGFALAERFARPGAKARTGLAIAAVFALVIAVLAAMQLATTSPEDMRSALLGSTWNKCPWRILVLSLPGLAALLWIMRGFAPTRPTLAGAAAGLLAGGIAATVYGLHCEEAATPFIAIFYTLGIALSTLAGALVGSRLLRW